LDSSEGLTEKVARPRRSWIARRKWVILLALLLVASGMVYTLVVAPAVDHSSAWIVPGDIWGTFRSAQYVGWGDIGDIYSGGTGLVTFPGIAVLLAPVTMLAGFLGLTASFQPIFLAHPTAWLVLGPTEMVAGTVVLFALDSLAEVMRLSIARRAVLLVLEAAALWPLLVIWGHPEDAIAVAFAVYALMEALARRWRWCGWLFGFGVLFQPLVLLMLPVLLATAPSRRWLKMIAQGATPSLTLLAIPLVQSWKATSHSLFVQPNFPAIDHPTPWISLAPVLAPAHRQVTKVSGAIRLGGSMKFSNGMLTRTFGEVVAAGPGRVLALVVCVAIGLWVYRAKPDPLGVVWWIAVSLSARCYFESVMDPYYLWPPVALILLAVASNRSWWRIGVTLAAISAASVYSYRYTGPWEWWLPVVGLLSIALALSRPTTRQRNDKLAERATRLEAKLSRFRETQQVEALR
jgi:hypothetical protein